MAERDRAGYVRHRLAAALPIVLIAVLASYLVDRSQNGPHPAPARDGRRARRGPHHSHREVAILTSLREARAERLAADDRTALIRSMPLLEVAAAQVRESVGEGAISPEAEALPLDPLVLPEESVFTAQVVAERPELWGDTVAPCRGGALGHLADPARPPPGRGPRGRRPRALHDRAGAAAPGGARGGLRPGGRDPDADRRAMECRMDDANEEARRGRRDAEAASEAGSAVIATTSHESRTPLTGVLSMTDLLADADLSTEEGRMADTIASSARVLLGIVDDVLDVSRLEAGRVGVDDAPFDAHALVRETGVLLMAQARAKGVRLRVDPRGGEAAPAHRGEEGRLRRVLSNLGSDAVKFTDEGEVALTLSAGPVRAERPGWTTSSAGPSFATTSPRRCTHTAPRPRPRRRPPRPRRPQPRGAPMTFTRAADLAMGHRIDGRRRRPHFRRPARSRLVGLCRPRHVGKFHRRDQHRGPLDTHNDAEGDGSVAGRGRIGPRPRRRLLGAFRPAHRGHGWT